MSTAVHPTDVTVHPPDVAVHAQAIAIHPVAETVPTAILPPGMRHPQTPALDARATTRDDEIAADPRRPRLRLVDDFGPVRTGLADLPDPRTWAGRIAVHLFEAAHGARPATQVMRWVAPDVYDSVVRRSARAARRGRVTRRPVRLRRVRTDVVLVPGDSRSVVESCVVLDDAQRVRVMALRLEGLDGRWLVTACEIG